MNDLGGVTLLDAGRRKKYLDVPKKGETLRSWEVSNLLGAGAIDTEWELTSRAYLTAGRDVKLAVLSGRISDLFFPELRGVAGSGTRTGWGKTIGKDAAGRNPSREDLGLGARCLQANANPVFAD